MSNKKEISIAIVPFEDLSSMDNASIFCKGFCMDLTIELSYFRQFNILSYTSGDLVINNGSIDHEKLNSFDVDYYIVGSFRNSEGEIRISAQLYQKKSRKLVWGNRFVKQFSDLIKLQESLLEEVVGALQSQIKTDLTKNLRHKPEVDLSAYEFWIKGVDELKNGNYNSDLKARKYFKKALLIEPEYSLAYSGISLTYFNEWSCIIWDKWDTRKNEAFEWAKKAIEIDAENYIAAFVIGRVLLFDHSFESAEYFLNESLNLNSNDPDTLAEIASCFVYLSRVEEAEALIKKAMRLNPLKRDKYNGVAALIYLEMSQYKLSKQFAEKSLSNKSVDFDAFCAATAYFLNDIEGMNSHWEAFLYSYASRILNSRKKPSTIEAVEWVKSVNPFKFPSRAGEFWNYISNSEDDRIKKPTTLSQENLKASFYKLNEVWYFEFANQNWTLPEVKGFRDLQRLIASPNTDIHCNDLMDPYTVLEGVEEIDAKSKNEYLNRIREIQNALDEADELSDYQKITSLHEEYDNIIDFLSKSHDKQGRVRKINETTDRLRSAVTWRIRSAISKIEKSNAQLGKHLSNSIRTGYFCRYSPEISIEWTIE